MAVLFSETVSSERPAGMALDGGDVSEARRGEVFAVNHEKITSLQKSPCG